MALVIVNDGLLKLLAQKTSYLGTLQVGLYVSNYTPQQNDTYTVYTAIEASFPGYSRQNFAAWGTPYLNSHSPQQGETDNSQLLLFTPSSTGAGQDVYGYFVVDPTGPTLIWAEKNPAGPVLVGANLIPYVIQGIFLETQAA